jgi:signal transduction histidine kinase
VGELGTSTSTALRRQFAWLASVLVIVGAVQLVGALVLLARFDGYSRRVDAAQDAHRVMLQAMTDAETGIRGWLLTGEKAYLEPYESGAGAFRPAAGRVTAAIDGRASRRLLGVESAVAEQWLTEFAEPIAAAPPEDAQPAVLARGNDLFDAYRADHEATAAALAAGRAGALANFRRLCIVLQTCLAGLAALALLVTLRLSARTHSLLLSPLAHLQGVLTRLAGGDGSARAEPRGPPEIQLLIETLNRSLDDNADAQHRLLTQERYLDQVLDVLNVGVVACSADGTIKRVNRNARLDMQGVAPPTHVRDLNRVTEDGEAREVAHPLAMALAGQVIRSKEMTFLPPGQPPKAVMVDACPLRDEDGRLIGAVATRYDVSVLRAREAELTAFAGIVAHDLRSPLAAIGGFIELLELDLAETDADVMAGPTVARIHAGVDRMRQLIDDLLAYATARDAPLRLEQVSLQNVVQDVVAERTEHLRLARDGGRIVPEIVAGALPVVHGDAAMIRQMMDNLIGNAIKYTRADEPARVRVTADRVDDRWTRINIEDRGIGIPAAQHASVFSSFHRAHLGQPYAGTGLGLAICQRVVDRHGGTISLDDNPLGGTRVHLVLPTAPG